jgi:hypothetical protein
MMHVQGNPLAKARGSVVLLAVVVTVFGFVGVASAQATVGWTVHAIAEPTHFSSGDVAECASAEGKCDRYQLVVLNTGDSPSSISEPVTITDRLPQGMTTLEGSHPVRSGTGPHGEEWNCPEAGLAVSEVSCTLSGSIAAGAYAPVLKIPVTAPSEKETSGTLTNEVAITGGGPGARASTKEETEISPQAPPFGVTGFSLEALNTDGTASSEAGAHPSVLLTNIDFATVFDPPSEGSPGTPVRAVEQVKDVVVELPAGFVGDPQALARCPLYASGLKTEVVPGTFELEEICASKNSAVGAVALDHDGSIGTSGDEFGDTSRVFNLTPEAGYPAEFGLSYFEYGAGMYASVIHNSSGYRLRVAVPGVTNTLTLTDVSLALFGDTTAHNGAGGAHTAFLTNPADCGEGPLTAKVEADSWEHPERWVSRETTAYPQVSECNLLQFDPSLELAPAPLAEEGTGQAGTPSAYNIDLKVPQRSLFEETATPALRDATVTLPEGVAVSPSSANGLVGCAATGPEGIDIANSEGRNPAEAGEGEALGADGVSYLVAGHCPAASTLASVEITTPLLPAPLQGHMFLAAPKCGGQGQPACTAASATNGELYGVYLEAAGSGIVVKQPGAIDINPVTGQVTSTFSALPQVPFSELKIHFHGGPRATLMTPRGCGTYTTSSRLTPWSAGAPTETSSAFTIADCAAAGFGPAFTAGTTSNQAGAFSPFGVTLSRQDSEQDLSGVSVTTPPGLLGVLKSVERCGEPQASQGTCGPNSLIGHTTVAAGPGPDPVWVQGGQVFLTGPYKGAPFGLSIVVPAVAGPFNLGNVVVRAAVSIDPHTAQITVASDPLPTILQGIPLQVRTVNVSIDRSGFMFNPTDCEPLTVGGSLTSTQGASVGVSSPFTASGCKSLPFHPVFSVSTQAKTSKKDGASLTVKTVYPAGAQANIRSVAVVLPKQLPARLTTIQQACPEATFNANPAGCPAGSDIGTGTASTPILAGALTGPAYLVSHGGAAFPDVVVILQGEGVTVDLVGSIDIKHGVTSSTFASVPDAPIGSFQLTLPEGPHSGLAAVVPAKAKGSLCGQSLSMPITITGQNGAALKQTPKIAVTGCPKAKKKAKPKKHTKGRKK